MLISAALDNINQEIYKIQKHQKDNSIKDIESIVINQIEMSIEELIQSIKESQINNKKEIEMLYDKIAKIEYNVKHLALPNLEVEEKPQKNKIRELYEIGYSIEEISKEVGIPPGEIKLMLKF
jgi:predicted RNase H-like nuclease (RuvC/YqgF family)